MAYTRRSKDPMYRVPSGPSTPDEETWLPVNKLHFTLPAGELLLPTVSMAYTRRSLDPMYRVPSGPSTPDEKTWSPVNKLHFSVCAIIARGVSSSKAAAHTSVAAAGTIFIKFVREAD